MNNPFSSEDLDMQDMARFPLGIRVTHLGLIRNWRRE